jgi:hypothetical protein
VNVADWRPRLAARLGDPWIALGVLGALLALTVLFIHEPASVWAGNVAEFHFRFNSFLRVGVTAILVGLAAAFLILTALPAKPRRLVASGTAAVGLIWWAYGEFLVTGMTVLNGQGAPMSFDTGLGATELVLVAVAGAIAIVGILKLRRLAMVGLVVLNIALVATSAATVHAVRRKPLKAPLALRDESIFRFSPTSNVLVILLDSLQADIADAVFRTTPEVKQALEGFQYYRDTMSSAPTTFLSMPSIHSGAAYQTDESLLAYFTDAILRRSFISRFADAGYDTTLVNPIEGMCPDRVTTCISTAAIVRSREALWRIESLRLLDLSLFRVAPVWVKRHIYNDGRWLLSGRVLRADAADPKPPNETFDDDQVLEGIRLFEEVARRFSLNDGTPTFKFLHSFATHPPYVLDRQCAVGESSLDSVTPQTRCALLGVVTLLNRLKQASIYDNATILILADHGMNAGFFNDPPGSHEEWVHLMGSAHPLFVLKRPGARGALREVSDQVYLPDVGATLCAASGACTTPLGIPAGQASAERPRRFYDYDWKHEYWKLRTIPNTTAYEVRGPLWRVESWLRR